MGMDDVTPDQIATFDQALADAENNLDVLIDLWRTGDPNSPEHIRIAGLCVALGERPEWDRIALAEHLTVAIRRLDRAGKAATPNGPRELIRLLSKRIADLRAEAGDEFCTCESYDCHGECCGIGNCTCTPDAGSGTADAIPDGPRTWALPDEPGPEVTAVRDRDGRAWKRMHLDWALWGCPETGAVLRFVDLLDHYGPLTDATPAADGQDGRDGVPTRFMEAPDDGDRESW